MIEDYDESKLFLKIKTVLSTLLIGQIYFGGGHGFAQLITNDPILQRKYGNYNIKLLAIEIIILLWLCWSFIFMPPISAVQEYIFNLLKIHAIITVASSLIYVFLFIPNNFPSDKIKGKHSIEEEIERNDAELYEIKTQETQAINRLDDIQDDLNIATDTYIENRNHGLNEIEIQRAEIRKKLIKDLTQIVELYGDEMNLSNSIQLRCKSMESLSHESLTQLSKDIQNQFSIFVEKIRNR